MPRSRLMKAALLLAVLAIAGCCKGKDNSAEARAAIDARNQEVGAAVAKGDAAAVAALYTADAVLMPPNMVPARGREAVEALWKAFLGAGIKGLVLTSTEVEGHGDSADEEGTYKVLGPENKVIDTGKYIVIWKQQGGQWFLHRDIWNSDLPPPLPPAAPAAAEAQAPPLH